MDSDDHRLRALLETLAGSPVASLEPIGRGGNSRVCLVRCRDGRQHVAKTYLQPTRDGLDRLEVEFGCLRFLEARGVAGVPRPVAACPKRRVALYERLEGEAVAEVAADDVLAMAAFLLRLRGLSRQTAPAEFPAASEACFSFEQVLANLDRRLALLREHGRDGPLAGELTRFLDGRLAPAVAEAGEWLGREFGRAFVRRRLPQDRRLLSPSDFGFHNALRAATGQLLFLDFEYFGWDDPAKAVADFLLHPAMALPLALRRLFLETMLRGLADDAGLPLRIRAAYPLFGLKWCCIILNEFMGSCWTRRTAAQAAPGDRAEVCAGQLAKAEALLAGLTAGGFGKSPYKDLL